jgi:hypothetical protein
MHNNCASSWLFTTFVPRCTVSKTYNSSLFTITLYSSVITTKRYLVLFYDVITESDCSLSQIVKRFFYCISYRCHREKWLHYKDQWQMCVSLHVKCPLVLFTLTKIGIWRKTSFAYATKKEISRKSVRWQSHWSVRTDGTGMTYLRVDYCDYLAKRLKMARQQIRPIKGSFLF